VPLGLNTIYLADLMIQSGEPTSSLPAAWVDDERTAHPPRIAGGFRYGDASFRTRHPTAWCAFDACLMGAGGEVLGVAQHLA
jgi:hypothetical protein